ncbi:hypothetical protein Ancab_001650 [Ancistrocladus abbreviatus]
MSASPTGSDSCYRGARANDESGSVHMGSSALPQDVMGRLIDNGGILRKHKGHKPGVNFGTSSFGDSLHDSHIMNRNQVLMAGNEHLGNGSPGLSPSAICAVLSQLGVVKESNVEEPVQQIADMEMRDTLLFSGTDKVSQSPP